MTFAKSDITCPIWSKVKPFRVHVTAIPVAFPAPYVAASVSQTVRAWSANISGTILACLWTVSVTSIPARPWMCYCQWRLKFTLMIVQTHWCHQKRHELVSLCLAQLDWWLAVQWWFQLPHVLFLDPVEAFHNPLIFRLLSSHPRSPLVCGHVSHVGGTSRRLIAVFW